MALAQGMQGFGIAPQMHLRIARLGANASEFCKRLQELGFHTLFIVFQMLQRPFGAGLNGPAFQRRTTWFGRFPRNPSDTVVHAAGCIPLRPQVAQARLIGQRVGQHQGPARSHTHLAHGHQALELGCWRTGLAQQKIGLHTGDGQDHLVKTTVLTAIRTHHLPSAFGLHAL